MRTARRTVRRSPLRRGDGAKSCAASSTTAAKKGTENERIQDRADSAQFQQDMYDVFSSNISVGTDGGERKDCDVYDVSSAGEEEESQHQQRRQPQGRYLSPKVKRHDDTRSKLAAAAVQFPAGLKTKDNQQCDISPMRYIRSIRRRSGGSRRPTLSNAEDPMPKRQKVEVAQSVGYNSSKAKQQRSKSPSQRVAFTLRRTRAPAVEKAGRDAAAMRPRTSRTLQFTEAAGLRSSRRNISDIAGAMPTPEVRKLSKANDLSTRASLESYIPSVSGGGRKGESLGHQHGSARVNPRPKSTRREEKRTRDHHIYASRYTASGDINGTDPSLSPQAWCKVPARDSVLGKEGKDGLSVSASTRSKLAEEAVAAAQEAVSLGAVVPTGQVKDFMDGVPPRRTILSSDEAVKLPASVVPQVFPLAPSERTARLLTDAPATGTALEAVLVSNRLKLVASAARAGSPLGIKANRRTYYGGGNFPAANEHGRLLDDEPFEWVRGEVLRNLAVPTAKAVFSTREGCTKAGGGAHKTETAATTQGDSLMERCSAQYSDLCSVLESTMKMEGGEETSNNSKRNQAVVLLGNRGAGKTLVLNRVLMMLQDRLMGSGAPGFIVVRLNGMFQTNEVSALREVCKQLCIDSELEPIPSRASFQAHLALLKSVLESTYTMGMSVFFVLDEFDRFAARIDSSVAGAGGVGPFGSAAIPSATVGMKQTLLYNLCELLQSDRVRLCIIGITTRLDIHDLLEKRIRSRISYRRIFFPHAVTLDAQYSVLSEGLLVRDPGRGASRALSALVKRHNNAVKQLLSSRAVAKRLKTLASLGFGVRWFNTAFAFAVATCRACLEYNSRGRDNLGDIAVPLPSSNELLGALDRFGEDVVERALTSCSVLELSLLVACMHLELLAENARNASDRRHNGAKSALATTPTNFVRAYDVYLKAVSARNMQALNVDSFPKIVCQKVFGRLLDIGLVRLIPRGGYASRQTGVLGIGTGVTPSSGSNVFTSGYGEQQFAAVVLACSPTQVRRAVKDMPGIPTWLRAWSNQSSVAK